MRRSMTPGRGWRWVRRLAQSLAIVTIIAAPLLGGWQRLDRSEMASWSASGWDLPDRVRHELPLGDRPAEAYDALVLTGGGIAVEYLSVPVMDPVAGLVTIIRGNISARIALAFALPLLLALLGGRIFCGWFCPFGALARIMRSIYSRVPWWKPPAWRIPRKRPVRWAVLIISVAVSIAGVHALLFFFLPHLLVQQTVYSFWLLGGGGAVLGALLGLILAGMLFGPTIYCATVCPTGAALGLVGRRKLVRVTLEDPEACGSCTLCNTACWLGLEPATGDPGGDCDNCARCFPVCPRDNLRVGVGAPKRRHLPVVAVIFMVGSWVLGATTANAAGRPEDADKPSLVLRGERIVNGVTVAASIVDKTGVKLDMDWGRPERGVDVAVFMARGLRAPADERGVLPSRDVYRGPLKVELTIDGEVRVLTFEEPNSPVSTPRRTIYLQHIGNRFSAGDELVVKAVPGWLERDLRWTVPRRGTTPGASAILIFLAGSALVFMGLLSLALAVHDEKEPPGAAGS